MGKYESGTWELINAKNLPKIDTSKDRINCKECIGETLIFKHKNTNQIYEIKIVNYIEGHKDDDGKQIRPKFKIEYIYFKGTEHEEVVEKVIDTNSLINKANIGGVIPSLNQWIKKEDYWIGIDTKGREFKFSAKNKETEYDILHSTWCFEGGGYITTKNLSNSGEIWKMHKAIYFNCNKEEADKNIHMCIDHINNNKTDNRVENLRLVTKTENSKNLKTNNKYGLIGLQREGKGYISIFKVNGYSIRTRIKNDLEEAKIDNLIAQEYLGYKHNEDQFYRLKELSKERIKEVTDLLDKKIESNKYKVKTIKENSYSFIKKDNLVGIKTFKKDGTENPICWVDRDFGRIEDNQYIIDGRINKDREYFNYTINGKKYRIHNYVLTGGISLQNYRNNNFNIDHINQKTSENYISNLEITTHKSNMMNKKGKGYIKSGIRYQVHYAYNWKYFNLYIGGTGQPTFNTEEEAIAEVRRRKEIVNKYRFRIGWQGSVEANVKALDEIIDFAEEHKLDIDSAYIVWKGLDTEENIKNYLNSIDK